MCWGVVFFGFGLLLTHGALAVDLCVRVCDGRFSTAGRHLPYLPSCV